VADQLLSAQTDQLFPSSASACMSNTGRLGLEKPGQKQSAPSCFLCEWIANPIIVRKLAQMSARCHQEEECQSVHFTKAIVFTLCWLRITGGLAAPKRDALRTPIELIATRQLQWCHLAYSVLPWHIPQLHPNSTNATD